MEQSYIGHVPVYHYKGLTGSWMQKTGQDGTSPL